MYASFKAYNEAIDQAMVRAAKIKEAQKEVLTHSSAVQRDTETLSEYQKVEMRDGIAYYKSRLHLPS